MTRADSILRELFAHRRLDEASPCFVPCAKCLAIHRPTVQGAIDRGAPLHFVLPGFPAKSPSKKKVLGELPDTADRLALLFLQKLCDRIEQLHPPGMRITLCSDGRVFSDVVGVAEVAVTAYRSALASLVRTHAALSLYCLEDALGDQSPDRLRALLCDRYAPSLCDDDDALFNGIHRFLFEDWLVLEPHKTRSRVRRECKARAMQTIQRSRAWGRLIKERFPEALRFSIHPQPAHAAKIGIQLGLSTGDRWLTPWHAVAVLRDREFVLMKRHEAERLCAHLIYEQGRPIHFEVA